MHIESNFMTIINSAIVSTGCILLGYNVLSSEKIHGHGQSFTLVHICVLAFLYLIASVVAEKKRVENRFLLYRNVKSQGLWCSVLFPLCLVCHTFRTSDNITDQDELSILLLVSSIPLSLITVVKNNRKKETVGNDKFHDVSVSILIFLLILPWLLSNRLACSLEAIFVLLWLLIYFLMVKSIPELFPQSFTAGESFIICQIMLWFSSNFLKHIYELLAYEPSIKKEYIFGMVAVEAVLICVILYQLLGKISIKLFYLLYGIIGAVFVLPILCLMLKRNPLIWLLKYLENEPYRFFLFIYWFLCTCLAVIVVYIHNSLSKDNSGQRKASTSTRKYFHFLVIAVYLPGLLLDPEFLKMSSFIVLGVLLLLEHIRIHNIPPLASPLEDAFQTFIDEKDSGYLTLTHIYLLVGCSLPLWIADDVNGRDVTMYSGLLSVGVGDTAASFFGSKFGKFQLLGTKKTAEGTVSSIIFQVAFLYVFSHFGLVENSVTSIRPLFSVILTSFLEASIEQIDNLILPLFMFFTIK